MRGKLTNKVLRSGMPQPDVSKVLGEVSLKVETAELLMRSVLQDVMSKRNEANSEERTHWLSQIAFAVHTCEASIQLADVTGASGGHLDNPVQRAVRDIAVASNHVVFSKTVNTPRWAGTCLVNNLGFSPKRFPSKAGYSGWM